jgi:hypothetical protein
MLHPSHRHADLLLGEGDLEERTGRDDMEAREVLVEVAEHANGLGGVLDFV